jgi:hypothetical protein
MMDPKIAELIRTQIYRRFPEVEGVKPTIRKQPVPDTYKGKKSDAGERNYLFTFKSHVSGPGGQKIPRYIRVVVTPAGKILKVSTSK